MAAMPEPEVRRRQYPHELSGGMRQRALIASALAGNPEILIADEPTTALDSLTQSHILELLGSLKRSGLALLLVSHDLHLVSQLADRIAVMRGGMILEQGSTAQVLSEPRHPYTRELVASVAKRRDAITVIPDASPLALSWQGIHRRYPGQDGTPIEALCDVSFQVRSGTTLGIVGQSGSGKSTLGRILMGLETPDSGVVEVFGQEWSGKSEKARRPLRGTIQLVEQNPLDALDPRWTVRRIVGEALELDATSDGRRGERLQEILGLVGLAPELLGRRPHQLSGGQRQRVAIARALARRPSILICDEPVSALDAVVQARILTLLGSLQRDLGLTLILISHDLGVIAQLSDEVLVLLEGQAIESGPVERILDNPSHSHTRALMEASRAL
jgi:peptide/nickel transport system ATP-binding protein